MRRTQRAKAILVSAGIFALCAGVIVAGVVGIELAAYQAAGRMGQLTTIQPTATPSRVGIIHPTCGVPGKPACSTPDTGWIPLVSNSSDAALSAMKQTWIFQVNLNDGGDHIHDLSHVGTPFLVRGLATAGRIVTDYYVLPIMDATGLITDVGLFALNVTHTALRFVATISHDGQYTIVRQPASAAVAALWQQRHVTLKAAARPYLVYLDINVDEIETGQIVWHAGGEPDTPLWLVPGSDGKKYVFGNDGKIYAEREIPLSA